MNHLIHKMWLIHCCCMINARVRIWTGELTIQGLYLSVLSPNISTCSNIAAIIQWHREFRANSFLLFTQITNNVPRHWFPSGEELHFLQYCERRLHLCLPASFEQSKKSHLHIYISVLWNTWKHLNSGVHWKHMFGCAHVDKHTQINT